MLKMLITWEQKVNTSSSVRVMWHARETGAVETDVKGFNLGGGSFLEELVFGAGMEISRKKCAWRSDCGKLQPCHAFFGFEVTKKCLSSLFS